MPARALLPPKGPSTQKPMDPVEVRPGFAAMLERIEGNGVRTIIVETASRFARDLMVQEVSEPNENL
jgi:DNA invertase Pin-like site-specific DNA recombinase